MSLQLISRSSDLMRLREEGYEIEIRANYLILRNVPYLNASKQVRFGILVSELTLAGDQTRKPSTHVMHFAGEFPCGKDGVQIVQIHNQSNETLLGPELSIQHTFSSKPSGGYADYYEKMTTYYAIISSPAHSVDPTLAEKNETVIAPISEDSVFHYADTASSRAGINVASQKLAADRIAIVGLGGTGSYVLDLIAKTPATEIHLFDGDRFRQHNAFRSPGAPSIETLRTDPMKVDYFQNLYSKMRKRIFAHPKFIDERNVKELTRFDFVFVCLDKGAPRRLIIEALEAAGIPFIDVGMGIRMVDDALIGVLRVTTCTANKSDHIAGRVPFVDVVGGDYSTNIQIADLNSLNAALAVVKWKKIRRFYLDLDREHTSTYTIDGNSLVNEDQDAA